MRGLPLLIAATFALPQSFATELPVSVTDDPAAFSASVHEKFLAENEEASGDIADAIEPSSNWRYYVRDGGMLMAVSVHKNVELGRLYACQSAIAGVTERLIQQGDDSPTTVRVVLIEPAIQDLLTAPRRTVQPLQIPANATSTMLVSPCYCQ